jgi:hypothetical protein
MDACKNKAASVSAPGGTICIWCARGKEFQSILPVRRLMARPRKDDCAAVPLSGQPFWVSEQGRGARVRHRKMHEKSDIEISIGMQGSVKSRARRSRLDIRVRISRSPESRRSGRSLVVLSPHSTGAAIFHSTSQTLPRLNRGLHSCIRHARRRASSRPAPLVTRTADLGPGPTAA